MSEPSTMGVQSRFRRMARGLGLVLLSLSITVATFALVAWFEATISG